MKFDTIFRWILVASIFSGLSALFLDFFAESTLPRPLSEYVAERWETELKISDIVVLCLAIPLVG
jgi:hypothetical protein